MRGRPRAVAREVRLGPAELGRLEETGALITQGYLVTGTVEAPRALSLRCSHLGCTVDLDRATGQLLCPCHQSRFDVDGQVIAGPAREPLRSATMDRDGQDWVVRG